MKERIARFEINDILPIALTLVVAGIGIAYMLDVSGDIKEDYCDGTNQHYQSGICYQCNSTYTVWNTSNQKCMNQSQAEGTTLAGDPGVAGSAEYNATNSMITAVLKLPNKMPIIVNIIVAAVILGILIRYLMVRYG